MNSLSRIFNYIIFGILIVLALYLSCNYALRCLDNYHLANTAESDVSSSLDLMKNTDISSEDDVNYLLKYLKKGLSKNNVLFNFTVSAYNNKIDLTGSISGTPVSIEYKEKTDMISKITSPSFIGSVLSIIVILFIVFIAIIINIGFKSIATGGARIIKNMVIMSIILTVISLFVAGAIDDFSVYREFYNKLAEQLIYYDL